LTVPALAPDFAAESLGCAGTEPAGAVALSEAAGAVADAIEPIADAGRAGPAVAGRVAAAGLAAGVCRNPMAVAGLHRNRNRRVKGAGEGLGMEMGGSDRETRTGPTACGVVVCKGRGGHGGGRRMRRVSDRVADEGTKRGFGAELLPEYDETRPCADSGRAGAEPPPPLGVCAAAWVGAKFRNERASFAAAEWSQQPLGELSNRRGPSTQPEARTKMSTTRARAHGRTRKLTHSLTHSQKHMDILVRTHTHVPPRAHTDRPADRPTNGQTDSPHTLRTTLRGCCAALHVRAR
jgi:hypothetical protein